MTPVRFAECNFTLAERQPEYQPLPAHWHEETAVITTCWQLSPKEIEQVVAHGHIFIQQLTFKHPLQPQLPTVLNPLTNAPAVIEVQHVEKVRYERDRYLELLEAIRPPEDCPFCDLEEGNGAGPCGNCMTLATLAGELSSQIKRIICNSAPNKTEPCAP